MKLVCYDDIYYLILTQDLLFSYTNKSGHLLGDYVKDNGFLQTDTFIPKNRIRDL